MDLENQQYKLFQLLHGDRDQSPLFVSSIPKVVASRLDWRSTKVFVTLRDAQKIRHHPQHGMDAMKGLQLPMVIRHGDYYQSQYRGSSLQLEVVLHELDKPKRAYFLVLCRNKEDTGIFLRTFYFSAELSRNKMANARKLMIQSTVNFFK